MALQQVPLFITTDNKEFKSEVEAEAHQAGLDQAPLINGYIQHAGLNDGKGKAQAGLLRRHLAAFLAYQASTLV